MLCINSPGCGQEGKTFGNNEIHAAFVPLGYFDLPSLLTGGLMFHTQSKQDFYPRLQGLCKDMIAKTDVQGLRNNTVYSNITNGSLKATLGCIVHQASL